MDVTVLADVFYLSHLPWMFFNPFPTIAWYQWKEEKRLARCFQLRYNVCRFVKDFYSSKQIDRHPDITKGGGKYIEVNRRVVFGMRSIGVGHNPVKNYVVSWIWQNQWGMKSMTIFHFKHFERSHKSGGWTVCQRQQMNCMVIKILPIRRYQWMTHGRKNDLYHHLE